MFSGGEPLLHPNILDMMRYVGEKGIHFGLSTNGIANSNELIMMLQKHHAFIQISLDSSDPDTYSRIRGNSRSEFVLDHIQKLIELDLDVSVGIVLCAQIIPTLGDTIRKLFRIKVPAIHVSEIKKAGQAETIYDAFRITNYYQILQQLYTLQKEIYPISSIDFIEDILVGCLNLRVSQDITSYCNAMGCKMIQIDYEKNIYHCKNLGSALYIGNLNETSLTNLIHKASRNCLPTADTISDCVTCEYKHICRGGCRAFTHGITGDMHAKHPRCEDIKLLIRQILSEKEQGALRDLEFQMAMSFDLNQMNGYTKWV